MLVDKLIHLFGALYLIWVSQPWIKFSPMSLTCLRFYSFMMPGKKKSSHISYCCLPTFYFILFFQSFSWRFSYVLIWEWLTTIRCCLPSYHDTVIGCYFFMKVVHMKWVISFFACYLHFSFGP